jgi:hypothetical protein
VRAAVLGALLSVSALAQASLATVTGVISDTVDAVVPGAQVAIRNTETNATRTMSSSGDGVFVITNLPPGPYELSVTMGGFRGYSQTGILLQVGQTLRADVKLEVGQVTEKVSVEASMVTINTESGTIKGDVIVREEIQELPLDGRDFMDLAYFVPGVVPRATGGQGSGLNVNGARASNTNMYVDGMNNRDPRGAGGIVRPNIDAMAEFKVEVSGFSAEYGKFAGGVINLALRSGTNAFHGDVNYHLRNDAFDARAFFEKDKHHLRRNQFAGTLAGPIRRDKLFFMMSYEGYRQSLENTRLGRVPTARESAGDFSQSRTNLGRPVLLWDRLAGSPCNAANTRACFPGNVIPASRVNPIGRMLIDLYPLPNTLEPSGLNYRTVASDEDSWDSLLGKVDWKMDSKNSFAFRYQRRTEDTMNPFGGSDLAGYPNIVTGARSLAGLDWTRMLTSTFLFEIRSGFSRNHIRARGAYARRNIAGELGLPDLVGESPDLPERQDFPRFTFTNYLPMGTNAAYPDVFDTTDIQLNSKLTWISGKHTVKVGGDIDRVRMNQPFHTNVRGVYNFSGVRSGDAVADGLLGWLNNSQRLVGTNYNAWRQTFYGAFINDDWKLARSLTLNLGLRYEVTGAPLDKDDRLGNFVIGLNKLVVSDKRGAPGFDQLVAAAGLSGQVVTASEAGLPKPVQYVDRNNFAPRAGFAWRAFNSDKLVVRGGYGIFYGGELLNPLRNDLSNNFPFAVREQFTGLNNDPGLVSLSSPFPVNRTSFQGILNVFGYELRPRTSYLQSWNFTIERELGRGTAIETGYVGSKGSHLVRRYDYNQPFRTQEWFAANGTNFPRPISGFNTINFYGTGSNSNYHSFQVSLRRRARSGAFFRVNYSWSKSIDDASQVTGNAEGGFPNALDSRNLFLDRGRSDFDYRHVFTTVGSYPLPFGRRKPLLNRMNRLGEAALGGWQLAGTLRLYSGGPFTVRTSNVDVNLGESDRPNRVRNGKREDKAARGRRGVDFPWYDLTAFEEVPCAPNTNSAATCNFQSNYGFEPFGFGNAGRNILDGPGTISSNMSLSKNYNLGEQRRIQVRVDVFNVLNRPNFVLENETRLFNALTGGYFLRTSDTGSNGGPRVFQAAVKFRF